MAVISVRNACKKYRTPGELTVLNGFNMEVERGSIYAMMGSSGSGKTTLLTCIVGINQLDHGTIELFGQPMNRINKTKIGYMPQEIALISGFTVREMIYFFGNIAGLEKEKLKERFEFLSMLLELPDQDRLTRDCSGGQQRRISFAVALVHEPEILVLDEPTVGLDPLLREKIWDYLVEISRKQNVTVLLTTHYIEEAGQATQLGLMRNGVQIAEDSPANILRIWETDNLEDAFLKMSERQEAGLDIAKSSNQLQVIDTVNDNKHNNFQPRNLDTSSGTNHAKVLQALLTKHFLEIVRHFGVFLLILIIPFIGCSALHFSIGGIIKDIKIAIVNNEISTMNDCLNKTASMPTIQNYVCLPNKASCRFINELKPEFMDIIFYKSYDEAYADFDRGNLFSIIQFSSNFSQSLLFFTDEELFDDGQIQVFVDSSAIQKTLQFKRQIFEAYQNFMEGLSQDCNRAKKAGNVPIVFESLLGGSLSDNKLTIVAGLVLAQCFVFSSYITSMSIITERTDGTWDRAIVAGVKPVHFIISHLTEGFFFGFVQFVMYVVYLSFVLTPSLTINIFKLVSLIVLLETTVGVTFGLFVSTITTTAMGAFIISQVFCFPIVFISGIIWPLQAAAKYLQIIGKLFPFAYPTAALRTIMVKDSNFYNHDTYMAVIVTLCWIIASVLLSFKFVDRK